MFYIEVLIYIYFYGVKNYGTMIKNLKLSGNYFVFRFSFFISLLTIIGGAFYISDKNNGVSDYNNKRDSELIETLDVDKDNLKSKKMQVKAENSRDENLTIDDSPGNGILQEENDTYERIKDILVSVGLGEERKIVATAYSNDAGSINVSKWRDGRTATMTIARWGVIAVDTRVIPFGSKVFIKGMGWFSAEDRGGKIKGNRIDIFYPTRNEALQFGVKNLEVIIVRKIQSKQTTNAGSKQKLLKHARVAWKPDTPT